MLVFFVDVGVLLGQGISISMACLYRSLLVGLSVFRFAISCCVSVCSCLVRRVQGGLKWRWYVRASAGRPLFQLGTREILSTSPSSRTPKLFAAVVTIWFNATLSFAHLLRASPVNRYISGLRNQETSRLFQKEQQPKHHERIDIRTFVLGTNWRFPGQPWIQNLSGDGLTDGRFDHELLLRSIFGSRILTLSERFGVVPV